MKPQSWIFYAIGYIQSMIKLTCKSKSYEIKKQHSVLCIDNALKVLKED